MNEEEIKNGGAALTAYSMMQFMHMTNEERGKRGNPRGATSLLRVGYFGDGDDF